MNKKHFTKIITLFIAWFGLSLIFMAKKDEQGEPKTASPKKKVKPEDKDQPAEDLPEQKVGDTPTPPWEMPAPEQKAEAEPVRKALDEAVSGITTEKKADQVASKLENLASDKKADEVKKEAQATKSEDPGQRLSESAREVEQAAASSKPEKKAADTITQTATAVEANGGKEREALAEAAQETLNPQQQGAPDARHEKQREYLRKAILKRMKPLDALDAELFLTVNHIPHTRMLNSFFYFLTFIFRGGSVWFGILGLILLLNPKRGWAAIRHAALPIEAATYSVEYPIKAYFRRRRPFISIIQAIVIGKKPGSWSFPSGHSASAFSGAWLLSREFPEASLLLYILAALVGFSRIYLGDHYPGDVLSGALTGIAIAETTSRLQKAGGRLVDKV